ncbi:cyclin-P isoform X2 [Pelobates fuscus]|uniref:cyclin-P isoform X2 n=1 Tax=Pelobates fuscus TaxID=191477 RepID=UPI002FE43D75
MDSKREPFKTKDNNRIMCKTGDKKKSLLTCVKGCIAHKAAGVLLNPSEKPAPESTNSQCNVGISNGVPPGPPSLSMWSEELARTMLAMNILAEQEYAAEIFNYMMRTQCYHVFRSGDIPKSVTAEMRNVLLDWLVQVHEYLALEEETLYLAVYLMNSYIRSHKIHTSMLQLLASTCLFIACKVEESLIPEPAELCFMMEDAFSKKDLMRMERKVLNRLKFDLRYTQPLYFLRLLSITGKCPEKTLYLAMYFMELTLREADGLTIEPALLACAALRLAHMVLALECRSLNSDLKWPGVLHLYSYRDAELISSQQLMAQFALRGEAKSTWQKYSRPQKHEVSTEPALNAKNLIRCISSLSVIPV